MLQNLSKRFALAAAVAASVAATPNAHACPLTDWLFGRNVYAAGYAPVAAPIAAAPMVGSPVVSSPVAATPYAAGYSPIAATPYAAGYSPISTALTPYAAARAPLPVTSGFQSAYTAGYAPAGTAIAPTANPVATTLSLRTPTTLPAYNAYRPFVPAGAGIPAATSYPLAAPSYYDNPSVYTGRPVVGGVASTLRGTAAASTIGAANTYPTGGVTYTSGFRGVTPTAGVIGGPLNSPAVSGIPATALPATPIQAVPIQTAPAPGGLGRFFGSLFGRGYQSNRYAAPVTYYRPATVANPVTGVSQVVQAGCTGSETLSTLTPVQQFDPTLGQVSSSVSVAPAAAYTPITPSATLPPTGFGSSSVISGGYEAPLSRSIDGSIVPQSYAEPLPSQFTPRSSVSASDATPIEQPQLRSRRQRIEPADDRRFGENGFEEDRFESNRLDDDRWSDDRRDDDNLYGERDADARGSYESRSPYEAYREGADRESSPRSNGSSDSRGESGREDSGRENSGDDETYRSYWELQDAADSTAMIPRRRSSLIRTNRSAEPIRGLDPQQQPSTRPQASRVAPPLPARSTSTRGRRSSANRSSLGGSSFGGSSFGGPSVRGYEISLRETQPKADARGTDRASRRPAAVTRDATWRPVQ